MLPARDPQNPGNTTSHSSDYHTPEGGREIIVSLVFFLEYSLIGLGAATSAFTHHWALAFARAYLKLFPLPNTKKVRPYTEGTAAFLPSS